MQYVNDNAEFDEFVDSVEETGPFMLAFFDADGYQNGELGPFADIEAAVDAALEAYEFARENNIKWYSTEIVPCSDYFWT
jgi:hypothetical protein